jgi:hypothetical protein
VTDPSKSVALTRFSLRTGPPSTSTGAEEPLIHSMQYAVFTGNPPYSILPYSVR